MTDPATGGPLRPEALRPNEPAPSDFVEIGHPDIDGTTPVARRTLPHWRDRGWHEVPAAPVEAPAADAVEQRQITAQDPASAEVPAGTQNSKAAARRAATTGQES